MSDDLHLWRAVIAQALADATSDAQSGTARYDRAQARHWLTHPSPDLSEVCALAGLEPEAVSEHARRLIAMADERTSPARADANGRLIEHEGQALTLTQWADRLGLNRITLRSRLRNGWSVVNALRAPPSHRRTPKPQAMSA